MTEVGPFLTFWKEILAVYATVVLVSAMLGGKEGLQWTIIFLPMLLLAGFLITMMMMSSLYLMLLIAGILEKFMPLLYVICGQALLCAGVAYSARVMGFPERTAGNILAAITMFLTLAVATEIFFYWCLSTAKCSA